VYYTLYIFLVSYIFNNFLRHWYLISLRRAPFWYLPCQAIKGPSALGATFAFDYIGFGEAYEVLGSNLLGCKQFLGSSPPAKLEYYPIHVEGAHYTGPALEGFLIIKKKKKKNCK
jgi:hypothetical protein